MESCVRDTDNVLLKNPDWFGIELEVVSTRMKQAKWSHQIYCLFYLYSAEGDIL